ncbi:MAG TPA: dTDP-4-dehydrorhamnose reductase, partial [Myxococcota bacterium]|nr:dTDP-4-dehydrorhamnose reductase [Myxococcota bacterium]
VGGQGMLGRAVRRQLVEHGLPHVVTDTDVDITDGTAVDGFADDVRATHIINCAAYTDVDGSEAAAPLAHRVNGEGPGHLARAAVRLRAVAVHVSTDYVFDGAGSAPYTEESPCRPLGAYGESKRAGEVAFLGAFEGAPTPAAGQVVRTSWLFGRGGKNFVGTMLRLFASKSEVGVVADQVGRPTSCDDLASALLMVVGLIPRSSTRPARAAPSGVYHFANTGAVSWYEFASRIHAMAIARGFPLVCERVRGITTADYPTPARRPAYSVLSTAKIARFLGAEPRPWEQALAEYLEAERAS